MYQITTAIKKIHKLDKRIRVIQGGTSAGKTIGILAVLIDLAQRDKKPTLTSVVSESFPHLKRGAIRDFLNIMEEQGYFKPDRWNKTEYTYTFETGSQLEFFSADQPGKVRGPRRQRLFLNEANNIPFESYEQLEVRTEQFVIIDYNPVSEFWAHEQLIGKRPDVDFLKVTYKDNEGLPKSIIDSIESRKDRKGWWQVYGLGEIGDVEGKIYNDWRIIDELPHEARLECYGLDFGYHPDPTAVVAIYYHNGGYILDQLLYQRGMDNNEIAKFLKNLPEKRIIADSAEPKSIAEIKAFGVSILPTVKGADSKRSGIRFVQGLRISVTKQSVDLIKEYRNYLWKMDKDGRIVAGETDERCQDHLMDATRYGFTSVVASHNMREMDDVYRERYSFASNRKVINPAR